MANVTLQQMLGRPFVMKAISRLAPAGTMLSAYYGLGPNGAATERALGRTLSYDVFNNTRQMSGVRAPQVGPARSKRQKVGTNTVQCMRIYDSIPIPYENLVNIRNIGGDYTTLDSMGQAYILRQQGYLAQRMANTHEFMVSRMFRGGWSLKVDADENYRLKEKGSGTIDVDTKVPTANTGQLALKSGGADIIDASWATNTTKIAAHMAEIAKASERLSGLPVTDVWINSTTYSKMLDNNQLAAVRGTSNRIFDTLTGQTIETTNGSRQSGISVQFGAIPQFKFHVYDAVSNVDVETDSTAVADTSLYIPDNVALMTPPPNTGWYGLGLGSEPIRKTLGGPVEMVTGLDAWDWPTDDPPGVELRALHNAVPILYIPNAVFYATVIF